MDALILARKQVAASITFHFLFPTISIGMGWVLLFFRLRWLTTRNRPDMPWHEAGSTPAARPLGRGVPDHAPSD